MQLHVCAVESISVGEIRRQDLVRGEAFGVGVTSFVRRGQALGGSINVNDEISGLVEEEAWGGRQGVIKRHFVRDLPRSLQMRRR
jgi:hypothetical protein